MRTLLAAAFVLLAALAARADYQREVLADSPKGYWRLGESSGTTATNLGTTSGIDGTYLNTPSLGADGALRHDANAAVTFASASSHSVSIPSHADLSPYQAVGSGQDFGVEFWFKQASWPAVETLVSKGGDNQVEWAVRSVNSDGTVQFVLFQPVASNYKSVISTQACPTNTWCHIYADVVNLGNNTGCLHVAVNRIKTTEGAQCGSGNDKSFGTNLVRISGFDSGVQYFNGTIDEVAIYATSLPSDARLDVHYKVGLQQIRRRRAKLDNLARPPVLALARDSALPWLTLAALRNMETAMEVHVEP